MGSSRVILGELGTMESIKKLGINFLPLEELESERWQKVDLPESHWKNGIEAPDFVVQKGCVVQVCNLKTHRFGGKFSASLKNSLGLIAKHSSKTSYNYMEELHSSLSQRLMIAEVNQIYTPELIIMDAVQCFISGGPETGELADSGVIAASRDRVALDATGYAILRRFTPRRIREYGPIFEEEQIKRAAELGLGVTSPEEIQLVTDDDASSLFAEGIKNLLSKAPLPGFND